MPTIYLSPSTQEFNPYIIGGSEEYYMNLVADAMEPYLRASGIRFTRNRPDMTAAQSIAQSNAGNYGLHLALHSNASPEALSGLLRGTDVYYYPYSASGRRAAEIFAANLRDIYPNPEMVTLRSTTALGEVSRTRAPAVFLELAYHDNVDDANWIANNIDAIARNLSLSVAQYFGVPLLEPQPVRQGRVTTSQTGLNIRSRPNTGAPIIGRAPRGATVTVYGQTDDGWMVIGYNNLIGYASGSYIRV
jgi:N-acetylmuramoyl-L-alanine amidase